MRSRLWNLRSFEAIQRGKSNKIIAYELGMCESTVKVHVRRIMKKLKAKNRTEVAVKSTKILGLELRDAARGLPESEAVP